MAQTFLRDKARQLRNTGSSLNEITKRLGIPKSTVRYWCQDIVLSKKRLKKLFQKQIMGGTLSAEKLRKKRLLKIRRLKEEGISEIGNLSRRELFLIGASLYLAEGYNKGDGEFGFTNSNPKIIKLIIRWLNDCCKISKDKIHLRIALNYLHKDRTASVLQFWSKATKIPKSQFSKPTFIKVKNKKTYLNPEKYFGTLRVKVRNSTDFRRKIMGWIEGIAKAA